MGMSMEHPLRAPLRRMLGLDVTREVVELRLGQEAVCVGWPANDRLLRHVDIGDMTPQQAQAACYGSREYRERMAREKRDDEDLFVPGARGWRCAYCRTVFAEQRCPTCGAGRTEG